MLHVVEYTARSLRLQWRAAVIVALLPAAGGCVGLSIPLGEVRAGAPTVTGSVTAAPALPRPLPAGLDASDAAAIAEAARRALAAGGPAVEEWRNPATGSRGTLAPLGEAELEAGATCRTYLSTVASLRGVHRYGWRACRAGEGRVTISPLEAAADAALAGI